MSMAVAAVREVYFADAASPTKHARPQHRAVGSLLPGEAVGAAAAVRCGRSPWLLEDLRTQNQFCVRKINFAYAKIFLRTQKYSHQNLFLLNPNLANTYLLSLGTYVNRQNNLAMIAKNIAVGDLAASCKLRPKSQAPARFVEGKARHLSRIGISLGDDELASFCFRVIMFTVIVRV